MEQNPAPEPAVADPYSYWLLQYRNGESSTEYSNDFFVPRHGVEGAHQNAVSAADSIISNDVEVDSISIQYHVIRRGGQKRKSSVQDTTIRRQ